MKKLLLILPIVIYILTSCYYDSEEALSGKPGACNTDSVKYSISVKPILDFYCYKCHSNSTAAKEGSGIKFEDNNDLKKYVINGQLLSSIEHTSGTDMPYRAAKLSICDISIIKSWIDAGAKFDIP